ncbi:MAG TPA: serine hydrolase [Candidatus Limnocylindria bacterium]
MHDAFAPLGALIAEVPFRIGVLVRSTDGETFLERDADVAFPAASVIKVPLVMTLYADAAEGRLSLDERSPIGERMDGSGVLRDLRDVRDLSLRDLAALTIGLSDNTATNRLIERVGVTRVAERTREWGIATTVLRRKMYDFEAARRGVENVATARELVALLGRLVDGRCVDRATSDAVLRLMERCQDETKLRRYLAPETIVASKSGTLDASRNDVAVFRGPARTILAAAFTTEVKNALAAEHVLGLLGRAAAVAAGIDVPSLPFAVAPLG